ncbi:hypothetical protein AMATHDRAFT_2538 [Amanita thiersii Skay4041]|uniref:Distal membrane-arm assembly complex protein 1-like domain-containing protein n=1 Tax=Amanita thiersii Skay4041 TaxID=703135 RepID=A0A2A9NM45_9AGAR|nr:hypothetical protein AMATHDRAFT_2538 [Amanita thiersii Skay4041]
MTASTSEAKQDCLGCRVVGSATFASVGAYALWQSRAAAPGTLLQKRITTVLGLAFLTGGIIRWY